MGHSLNEADAAVGRKRDGSAGVLVIGGGPGGAACAARLAQRGVAVTLAERSPFPRPKVCGCCLGGAGLAALETLGCRDRIEALGQPLSRWRGSVGGRSVEIPSRGLALSRERLDTELLAEASRLGVEVHQPLAAAVEAVEPDGVTVRLGDRCRRFPVVVLASGLSGAGPRDAGREPLLPWIEPPGGPFGVGITLPSAEGDAAREIESGVIYMACDDDGYVGMVRLEDGRVDLAAALRRGAPAGADASPVGRVSAILAAAGFPFPQLDRVTRPLATGPLRRRRLAGRARLLAVGDAAGYVEPFTGEGMTWAMQTGIAAADLIGEQSGQFGGIGDRWACQIETLMGKRQRRCRLVAAALRSRGLRRVAGVALERFPVLARPLVRHLERGQPFPTVAASGNRPASTVSPDEKKDQP